ncbi:unannotated protein [freshwater metagenome]|uniref:Unannotated protein n=1 Tax=freshwater metagenome TaxID=449393 RepID=A0A6J6AQP7_9ZZZZ
MTGIVELKLRWRNVIGATPFEDLVFAVLLGGLLLIHALQRAVVAFIEAPRPANGDPEAVHGIEGEVGGANGSGLHGGMENGGGDAGCGHSGPSGSGLGPALVGEIGVVPTSEEVFKVPGALTMAQQDEGGSHGSSLPQRDRGLGPVGGRR